MHCQVQVRMRCRGQDRQRPKAAAQRVAADPQPSLRLSKLRYNEPKASSTGSNYVPRWRRPWIRDPFFQPESRQSVWVSSTSARDPPYAPATAAAVAISGPIAEITERSPSRSAPRTRMPGPGAQSVFVCMLIDIDEHAYDQAAFSSDRARVVTVSMDNTVLWDAKTGVRLTLSVR